ncbi:hypothetical protein Hte_000140 [Hypoxylon texense]
MSPFKSFVITLACFVNDDHHLHLAVGKKSPKDEVTPHTPPSSQPSNTDNPELDESATQVAFDENTTNEKAIGEKAIDEEAIEDAYHYALKGCKGYKTFDLKLYESYLRLYSKIVAEGKLARDVKNGELRLAWHHSTGKIVIETGATTLHKIFSRQLGDALRRELDRVAREGGPQLLALRKNMGPRGRFDKEIDESKMPEWQLRYWAEEKHGSTHPSFVLRVAFNANREEILRKAVYFFSMSPLSACTVLDDTTCYHGASLSLWTLEKRSGIVHRNLALGTQVFRNKKGMDMPGELAIPFELLLPLEDRSKVPDGARDAKLRLSFKELSDLVGSAEKRQNNKKRSTSRGIWQRYIEEHGGIFAPELRRVNPFL